MDLSFIYWMSNIWFSLYFGTCIFIDQTLGSNFVENYFYCSWSQETLKCIYITLHYIIFYLFRWKKGNCVHFVICCFNSLQIAFKNLLHMDFVIIAPTKIYSTIKYIEYWMKFDFIESSATSWCVVSVDKITISCYIYVIMKTNWNSMQSSLKLVNSTIDFSNSACAWCVWQEHNLDCVPMYLKKNLLILHM